MADRALVTEVAGETKSTEVGPRLVVDLLQKTYWDGSNLVFKGTAFYIGILAALVGYVVTQRVPRKVAELTLYAGIVTSGLAVIAAISSGWTMYRCVNLLEKLMVQQKIEGLRDSDLPGLFSRWRKTIWAFGICGSLLVALFVSGMVVLLQSLDQIRATP